MQLTGGAPGSLAIPPYHNLSSGAVPISNAAAGSFLAGGSQQNDGAVPTVRGGRVAAVRNLMINNTTAGALTYILYLVPIGINSVAGVGAVAISGSVSVAANTLSNPIGASGPVYIPSGFELWAIGSAAGLTAVASWDQER